MAGTGSGALTCSNPGGGLSGPADMHCQGVPPQPVSPAACFADGGSDEAATAPGSGGADDAAEADDAGPGDGSAATADSATPQPGPCGENGGDFGTTMYGTEGDDDDCKYHVSYQVSGICQNDGVYFTVTATYLVGSGGPVTGAAPYAEVCWNLDDTHQPPLADGPPPDGKQQVIESPPGTYLIGPVVFDEPGTWTVRFHFNEECYDLVPDSPHGHAAFFVEVPQTDAGTTYGGGDAAACASTTPSYAGAIAPILQTYCTSCHSADGSAGFDETTYAEVASQLSPILDQVSLGLMPPSGSALLPPSDRTTLLEWLGCGAPDN